MQVGAEQKDVDTGATFCHWEPGLVLDSSRPLSSLAHGAPAQISMSFPPSSQCSHPHHQLSPPELEGLCCLQQNIAALSSFKSRSSSASYRNSGDLNNGIKVKLLGVLPGEGETSDIVINILANSFKKFSIKDRILCACKYKYKF